MNWLPTISGLLVLSIYPLNWYLRSRKLYYVTIVRTGHKHSIRAHSFEGAKKKARKLAAKVGASRYHIEQV